MRGTLATVAAFGAMVAPAGAGTTATATPNTTRSPAVLHVELDGTQPPVSGRFPERVVLSLQKGFRLDLKAIARRCPRSQVEGDAQGAGCPAKSAIGSGLILAHYLGIDTELPLRLFLAKRQRRGDVAGVVVASTTQGGQHQAAMGRIVRAGTHPYGLSVIVPVPVSDLYGSPVMLTSFSADLGANAKGRPLSRRVKRRRHHFLRTPKTCTGAWASNGAFVFRDGSTATVDAPIDCR